MKKEQLIAMANNPAVLEQQLIAWRHELHMHPETAFEEVETSRFISNLLEAAGLDVHRGIGGTGFVANLKVGTGKRVIGMRADMDALNMTEEGEVPWRSQIPGKMHGCGHDGHMIMLLGAALKLAVQPNFDGTIRFVFQPAEEPGTGAKAMMKDGLLEKFPMEEIYSLHNRPVKPFGTINTTSGPIQASEDNFTITIQGKGGHASAPQNTIDPMIVASQVILGLQTIVSRNVNPQSCAVISCTEIHTDGAHNAIPSKAVITGDTRSYSPEVQDLLEKRMREICMNICQAYGAKCDFLYTRVFDTTINWKDQVKKCVAAGVRAAGAENTFDDFEPSTGSEDFGVFLQQIPGCNMFLGTGENEVMSNNTLLHNPRFDFNDKIIMTGVNYWYELAGICLPKA